ncbi:MULTISPECIES: serine/threonine protein kinase [unclassified Streptomyces]|uniref:serine/threonine protein kinase n=1 Tax=unclassified Streptomyces TaxID=2593676 RepID=UPI0034049B66
MSDPQLSRSVALAYASVGMDPPAPVPLRKSDPARVGPYVLVSRLGSGGMGRVYLGRDTVGRTGMAAVKVIRPEYAEDPQFRKRFEREVGALDRVQGAHIVRLLGSGFDEDLVWVATEYVPGPTLDEVVTARGPIDATTAWRLLADMGRAVEAIWRAGLVHRDLKPSNVILAADGARVIDFGVVQATTGDTTITVTGQHVGTPAFMSPEHVRGVEVTAASDIFSLASALTYAVAGQAPFGEGTGVDVLHSVAFDPPRDEVLDKVTAADAELGAFVRTCLDKDPKRRPSPETVFRTAIGHQLPAPAGRPPRAPKRTPLRETRPAALASVPPGAPSAGSAAAGSPAAPASGKRRKLMWGAAAVAAVLVAGGVTAAMLRQGDAPASAAPEAPTSSAETDSSASTPSSSQEASTPAPSKSKADDQSAEKSSSPVATHESATPDGHSTSPAPVRAGSVTVTQNVNGASVARCLDTRGPDVQVWGCKGAATQKWALYQVSGHDPQYLVVNQGNHLCLDADAGMTGRNGQKIRARNCDGQSAQLWRLGGGGTLISVPDGFCLDAEAETSGQDGQKVQAWGCAGSVNQSWNWS